MMLSAALSYAARGLRVLPLEAGGKDPDGRRAPHGVYDATSLAIACRARWSAFPAPNVGIAIDVGLLSDVRVLDIDPKNGGDVEFARLVAEHGPLPRTPEQRTGSGGAHYLFTGWPDAALRTKLGPGVELLGPGRYFVAAPSVHPNGRRYEWVVGLDVPIATAPAWIVQLASRRMPRRTTLTHTITSGSAYARGALRRAIDAVERAPNGDRNNTLNAQTFSIARFVQAGALDGQFVADALIDAACVAGLTSREAEKTVASALRARRTP